MRGDLLPEQAGACGSFPEATGPSASAEEGNISCILMALGAQLWPGAG